MNKIRILVATTIAVTAMSITTFAACVRNNTNEGTINHNPVGTYWMDNKTGETLKDLWTWVDTDGDGKKEKCYFGSDGYMVVYTEINGCYVDENGNIIEEGVVDTN